LRIEWLGLSVYNETKEHEESEISNDRKAVDAVFVCAVRHNSRKLSSGLAQPVPTL